LCESRVLYVPFKRIFLNSVTIQPSTRYQVLKSINYKVFKYFNKKTAVPEPNHTNDIPCSSNIINNTEIESNTDTTNLTELTEIYDIFVYKNI